MRKNKLLVPILTLLLGVSSIYLTSCSLFKKMGSSSEDSLDLAIEDASGDYGEGGEEGDEDTLFEGEEGDEEGLESAENEEGLEETTEGDESESLTDPEGEEDASEDEQTLAENEEDEESIDSAGTLSSDSNDFSSGDSSSDLTSSFSTEKKRSWIPVKKIASQPFRKKGYLINAVYLVRKEDDLTKISQKIFQMDKTEDLLKINSHFKNRALKSGDKIYYNSPSRPNDDQNLLIYYEDIGLSPNVYTSSAGDNIRTVSKKLLNDPNGWKEVWATNFDVESKTTLPAGIQLRYWSESAQQQYAMNNQPATPMNNDPPIVPSNPTQEPQTAMEGNPSTDGGRDNQTNEFEPQTFDSPPPMPKEPEPFNPPPIPSEPSPGEMKQSASNNKPLLNQNKKLTYGVIGIALSVLMLILLLVSRKKKPKKIIDFTDTSNL